MIHKFTWLKISFTWLFICRGNPSVSKNPTRTIFRLFTWVSNPFTWLLIWFGNPNFSANPTYAFYLCLVHLIVNSVHLRVKRCTYIQRWTGGKLVHLCIFQSILEIFIGFNCCSFPLNIDCGCDLWLILIICVYCLILL